MKLLAFCIFVVLGGMASTGYGIWVALHLKNLPAFPIWIGVVFGILLTLKIGQILGEVINDLKEGESHESNS